jgi:hypothetical protein
MKRVLSIDGGGIRGIIPAVVLREFERCTNLKCVDIFDILVGTLWLTQKNMDLSLRTGNRVAPSSGPVSEAGLKPGQ